VFKGLIMLYLTTLPVIFMFTP